MKVVHGSLKETLYEKPASDAATSLRKTKETDYRAGEVTHITDQIGLHEVQNEGPEEIAVSLHCMSVQDTATSNPDVDSIYATKCCGLWI